MPYLKPQDFKGLQSQYPYPTTRNPKEKKEDVEYYLAVNRAMMSDYASGALAIPMEFGNKRTIQELRAYAKGKQDPEKYKKWLLGRKKKQKDGSKAWVTIMNISWDVHQKMPQMLDQMRSRNMSHDYDIDLHCIDEDSVAAKRADLEMMKFLVDRNTTEFAKNAMFKVNFQPDPEELGLMTNDDIDMYGETGGYSLEWEMAAMAAWRKTRMASNYKVLQDATFDDLIINPEGICGWKAYIDPSDMIPKLRPVKMDKALVQYSDSNNFDNMTIAGELREMTIAQVRRECPWMTGAQLKHLAKCFGWMNPGYVAQLGSGGFYGSGSNSFGSTHPDTDPISRVRVLVLDSQWLSEDEETRLKNQKRGFYKEVDYGYKADDKSINKGDRVIKKNVIRKYYSKWIVGTDYLLDYGVDKNNVYYGPNGNKTPRLDYFFTKTGNSSLVERCISILDDITLVMLKHRNAWATLPASPALAIQKSLIENVFLNGVKQTPRDIVQGLIEGGILYYDGLDQHGDPLYMAGGQKPIEALDVTRMAGILSICSAEIALKVNELREVLGLQMGADGGAQDRYQGLGQTQLAFERANASLQPTFNSYRYLLEEAAEHILKMWQIVAKDAKHNKIAADALGAKSLKVFQLGKEFTNSEFHIEVKIGATEDEKIALMAELSKLKDLGSQTGGTQGLSASEYMYVYDKVMAGNIKEAMYVMSKIEQKKRQAAIAQQQGEQEANRLANEAAARAKGEEDRANIVEKGKTTKENTMLSELLKTQAMLLDRLTAPSKEGESRANPAVIGGIMQQTGQGIEEVMTSEERAAQEAQQAEIAAMQEQEQAVQPV